MCLYERHRWRGRSLFDEWMASFQKPNSYCAFSCACVATPLAHTFVHVRFAIGDVRRANVIQQSGWNTVVYGMRKSSCLLFHLTYIFGRMGSVVRLHRKRQQSIPRKQLLVDDYEVRIGSATFHIMFLLIPINFHVDYVEHDYETFYGAFDFQYGELFYVWWWCLFLFFSFHSSYSAM